MGTVYENNPKWHLEYMELWVYGAEPRATPEASIKHTHHPRSPHQHKKWEFQQRTWTMHVSRLQPSEPSPLAHLTLTILFTPWSLLCGDRAILTGYHGQVANTTLVGHCASPIAREGKKQ